MISLKDVIGNYDIFLKDIISRITKEGFDFADFVQLDHMCYRTVSKENYADKKAELSKLGEILTETMVNGRPIATFRLKKPVIFDRWRIDCIELPAPKDNDAHSEGLEHVEFVLYDPIDEFLDKYSDKKFEMRAADRGVNPEIGYSLDGFSVKFHILSLQTATYLEKKLDITVVADGK